MNGQTIMRRKPKTRAAARIRDLVKGDRKAGWKGVEVDVPYEPVYIPVAKAIGDEIVVNTHERGPSGSSIDEPYPSEDRRGRVIMERPILDVAKRNETLRTIGLGDLCLDETKRWVMNDDGSIISISDDELLFE